MVMRNPWLSKKFKIYSHKITTPLVLYHDSDWHVGPESNLNRMITIQEEVKQIKPDFRIISGDIIDDTRTLDSDNRKIIADMLEESNHICPTIVSIGNHDIAKKNGPNELDWEKDIRLDWFQEISQKTDSYLVEENKIFEGTVYFDDQIEIVCINPPYEHYFKKEEAKEDFLNIYRNKNIHFYTGEDHYHILVLHTPAVAPELVNELPILQEADIILSGHMHAGIMPPYLRPIMNHTKNHWGLRTPNNQLLWNAKYCYGELDKDGKKFLINPGVTKIAPEKGFLQVLNHFLPNESYQIELLPEKQKVLTR